MVRASSFHASSSSRATATAQSQPRPGSRSRDVARVVLAHPEHDRHPPREGRQREDEGEGMRSEEPDDVDPAKLPREDARRSDERAQHGPDVPDARVVGEGDEADALGRQRVGRRPARRVEASEDDDLVDARR